MKSTNCARTGGKLRHPKIPTSAERTPLTHAVRWIATGAPCLSWSDAEATNDWPSIVDDKSSWAGARRDLVLAVRHKRILPTGRLVLRNDRNEEWQGFIADELHPVWDAYICQYRPLLDVADKGCIVAVTSQTIPDTLWTVDSVGWNGNWMYYCNGDVQIEFNRISISFRELSSVFSQNLEEGILEEGPILSASERKSLLTMIAGMSIDRYHYKADATQNPAVSRIVASCERQGLKIDPKTVRKWLKAAAELVDPSRE